MNLKAQLSVFATDLIISSGGKKDSVSRKTLGSWRNEALIFEMRPPLVSIRFKNIVQELIYFFLTSYS